MVVRTAARPYPPAFSPAVIRLVQAHLVLPADRTAAWRIEASLFKPFLVLVTECKGFITLHAKKHLIVHNFSPVKFSSSFQALRFIHWRQATG